MKYFFDNYFIKNNEIIFYVYIFLIILIILLTFIIGYKEIKKK